MNIVALTAVADYNLDSKNTVLGAGISGLDLGVATLGGAVTYDTDASLFAYEGVTTVSGLTAYVNGDQNDAFQNVGGSYDYGFGGATLSAGVNYDINTKDFAPTAGLAFAF
jgi:NAD/NADP transhydrogenase alpha subunit